MACGWSSCSNDAYIYIGELDLTAEEDRGPAITASGADNLWYQNGWVRGSWNASTQDSDPSGICGAFVVFGSLPAIGVAHPDISPDRSRWLQCPLQGVSATIDTATSQGSDGIGEGTMNLRLSADNAAAVHSETSRTVYVDNSTPTLSLAGPSDAPATAGTQYVSATAGGSPSGIAGFSCSTDGAAAQWLPGASARIPVQGLGQHTIICRAANNAVDPGGNHGWSQPQTWSLRIGQPTTLGVSFTKLVNGLRCQRTSERVRSAPHWITVRRAGRLIRIKSTTRTVRVTRCHPQTARRRVVVWTTVRRNGRLLRVKRVEFVSVVLPPRQLNQTTQQVAFGHATTVNGWLGSANGTALAGQPVRVLTAPDNGHGDFTQAAVATTRSDGSWSARLPKGPSRVVEAVYDGAPTAEPTQSSTVHVSVPAVVDIQVTPRVVPWGSHLRITGRVLGGYIPPRSNVLKLLFGDGPKPHTIGTPDIRPNGTFSIRIAWSTGRGVVDYWFAVATLAEADYPYARGVSRRVAVTVGRPTPHRR